MSREPKEVEAKFLPRGPAVLRKLEKLRMLGRFRLKSRRTELQENQYLDTEDLRLRQARAVLKVRRAGGKSEITFKRELSYRNGVSERIEVTMPLPVGTTYLDPSRYVVPMEIEPVRRAREITGSRPLREILNLRTRRRSLIFASGPEKVEVDLDRVEVRWDKKTVARFSEIELENLTASEESFRELLRGWKRLFRGEIRSSGIPKVELGLRLLKKQREDR
jgi:inorganic triphosphatase YgiF